MALDVSTRVSPKHKLDQPLNEGGQERSVDQASPHKKIRPASTETSIETDGRSLDSLASLSISPDPYHLHAQSLEVQQEEAARMLPPTGPSRDGSESQQVVLMKDDPAPLAQGTQMGTTSTEWGMVMMTAHLALSQILTRERIPRVLTQCSYHH